MSPHHLDRSFLFLPLQILLRNGFRHEIKEMKSKRRTHDIAARVLVVYAFSEYDVFFAYKAHWRQDWPWKYGMRK